MIKIYNILNFNFINKLFDSIVNKCDNLLNEDFITIFGNPLSGSFQTELLAQGNKITVLKSLKNYIKLLNNGIFILASTLILVAALNYFQKWPKKADKHSLNINHNELGLCCKCKLNIINVAFLQCNHFNLCEDCFINNNRKCNFCQSINQDYMIFENK
jgi:hypothetical protein